MSLFWLRVALALYALGLLHALITVIGRRMQTFRYALGAISLAVVLHSVSIIESGLAQNRFPVANFQEAVSALALVIAIVFFAVYWRYRLEALGVFMFPLVFMLTLAAVLSTDTPNGGPILRSFWLPLHAGMFLLGDTLFFLTFVTALMYLLEERELKSKKPRAFYYRLPPLAVLDEISQKTLAWGFPLVTVGISIGAFFASRNMGRDWALDPKIAWSFVTWLIYLGLVFSRWTAGWRGRKAAYLAIAGFAAVVVSWGASSSVHSFLSR
jgi:cytochrome c-type biogenesis protein CcsB